MSIDSRSPGQRNRHILLVDDEVIIAMAQAQRLEARGYRVSLAHNGEEAVERAVEDDVDLILMDIDLGRSAIDGTEAAGRILVRRDVPLIFLSGHTEPEIVDRTEQISSYGYVVKDSGDTVLDASIRMAFRLHRAYTTIAEHAQALTESEERFHQIFMNMQEGVGIYRPVDDGNDFEFIDLNPAGLAQGRIERHEVVGRRLSEVFPGPAGSAARRALQEVYRTGEPMHLPIANYQGDTLVLLVETYAFALPSGPLVAVFYDTTERQLAEEQVRFQAELLKAVGDAVIATDSDGIVTYLNPAAERLYGWPAAEAVGQHIMHVTVAEQSQEQAEEILQSLRRGESWSGEFPVHSRGGRTFTAHVANAPIRDANGDIAGIVGVSHELPRRAAP